MVTNACHYSSNPSDDILSDQDLIIESITMDPLPSSIKYIISTKVKCTTNTEGAVHVHAMSCD